MRSNPLLTVHRCGQGVWLDFIRRRWLEDGTLLEFIRRDHVSGLTANAADFGGAAAGEGEYDVPIAGLAARGLAPDEICERLMRNDVALAAAQLLAVHARTAGADGYASLGVSPRLAYDAAGIMAQARRLWASLARPNVMIAVPATREGLTAVRPLLAEGVNVDVTLLFGGIRYREVVAAWLAALEDRASAGRPLGSVASVASVSLRHIDAAVDRRLDAIGGSEAQALRGRAAIACARIAYAHLQQVLATPRWRWLAARGARPQRLLWASTSPGEQARADLMYVDALIGPQTVTALAPRTLDAYRDHGRPARRIGDDGLAAQRIVRALGRLGIDMEEVAGVLEGEGVRESVAAREALCARMAQARACRGRARR